MLNKPEFWNKKKSFVSFLLIPFSLLIIFFIFIKKKIINEKTFEIPIICIGNIYIGGTGKTPTSIYIVRELKKLNKNPVIIRKFYKNHIDEHLMIKQATKTLIVDRKRSKAIEIAEKKYDLAIMDDGFQDQSIKKDLNILCFNSNQLIGNGYIIPAGPLRENLNAVKDAHIILINGDKSEDFEKKLKKINSNIKIYYSNYIIQNISEFQSKDIYAFAGIGNPKNFFDILTSSNLNLKKSFTFPDHYEFNKSELIKILEEATENNCEVVTTEKDFFRIENLGIRNIKCCKVSLEVMENQKFVSDIKKIYA